MVAAVETMAWAGETPWHGLGVKVNNDLSTEEMLVAAGLDWQVDSLPIFTNINDNKHILPNNQALVRLSDNEVLSVISKDWKHVQNSEAFDFFKEFVESGKMEMHTAGSLRNGKMIWALAKINESFTLFNGKDQVDSYLLFSNPHEYGKGINVRFTPIRVVCNNTLTLALSTKSDGEIKLNHRTAFDPELVKTTMGISSEKMAMYKNNAEFLASKRYTQETSLEYLNRLFPRTKIVISNDEDGDTKKISKPASLIYKSLETQPGHEFGAGTWWSMFNAVTYNIDHVLGNTNQTRLNSAWYGVNRNKKIMAMQLAGEFASAS